MKTMTCKQLGGACDLAFHAETFEEMAEQSMQHGKEMFAKNDEAHLEAMENMKKLMRDPREMGEWMAAKRAEFNALAED